VTLTVVSNDLEAEMLCGMLRANGIECSYAKTDVGSALAMYTAISQAGPTTVLVDETRLEQARRLLPDGS
jgi:Putative prokaryotic signal transducing protein